uniref:Ovule protein n=1 Tax=Caenorhabditis tropicalis TaxID=1561998 RepID=A0A1I7UB68_9PELO
MSRSKFIKVQKEIKNASHFASYSIPYPTFVVSSSSSSSFTFHSHFQHESEQYNFKTLNIMFVGSKQKDSVSP